LIDLADEVAYNTADLDDAWSAGLIDADEIAAAAPAYREIREAVETQFPGAERRELFYESLRQLVNVLVTGMIEGTLAKAREAGAETYEDVREHGSRLAAFTPEAAAASRDLKRFLYTRVYASDELAGDRERSMRAIADLFGYFLKDPERLPEGYSERARMEPAHRVICDYIAGMTDAYFNRVYAGELG
jgi:dGTPase